MRCQRRTARTEPTPQTAPPTLTKEMLASPILAGAVAPKPPLAPSGAGAAGSSPCFNYAVIV